MDYESEISFANRTASSYRINVSVIASRCGVLDDLPSWIHGNSERDGEARDGGMGRLN
jgi:hypothetical protein